MMPHLLNKDLRAVRPWLVAIALLSLAIMILPQSGQWRDREWQDWAFWVSWLSWVAVGGLQWHLLHLDPPAGSRRFIGTRPVSGAVVGWSKLLVIVGAGVLPVVLGTAVRLMVSGMAVPIRDVLGMSLQNALLLSAILALFAAPLALPIRSVWVNGLAFLLGIILLLWSLVIISQPTPAAFRWPALVLFGLGAAANVGVMTRYARWNLWPRLILGLTLGCGVSAGATALFDIGRRDQQPETRAEASLKMIAMHNPLSFQMHEAGSPLEIRCSCHIAGMPEGVYAEQGGVTGTLQIHGQATTVHPLGWDRISSHQWVVLPDIAFHALPKNPRPAAAALQAGQSLYLPLGLVSSSGVKSGDRLRVTLRGTCFFDLFRAELMETVPLEAGRSWSGGGLRLEMHEVIAGHSSIGLEMETDVFGLDPRRLRQDLNYGVGDLGFFGVNLAAGEIYKLESSSRSPALYPLQRQRRYQTTLRLPLNTEWWRFPVQRGEGVAAKDVKLGIFRRSKIGGGAAPFEFVDVEIVVR